MKGLNYSSITALLRRIHAAKSRSDQTGISVKELLDRDRELRRKLQIERREREQRRQFLRTAGGIGLGAAMAPMAYANNGNGNGNNQPTVAIVGGGTGGLRTAHRLMQYGIDSKVFEANDRVGGRMWSDRDFFSDNRVVEWGGEFVSTEHTALRNLVHQLGLDLEDANKLSLGEEETYSIDGVIYTEADLLDEWVGGLYDTMNQAESDAPWQPMYNSVHTAEHLMYDNLDAIDWMTSIGYPSSHWVHKLLLTDLVAEYGITVGNSALNLIYLLGFSNRGSGGLPLAGTDERFHIVGGNDQVPVTMAAELPSGSVELERMLVQIDGDYAGPYTLHFTDTAGNNSSSETCDVLVMALPLNLIKNVSIDSRIWSGLIPQKQQAILSSNTSSDNGKIMFEFSDRHWDLVRNIDGEDIHMAARAFSNPDKFISTWEGEPGNPSSLGVLVDYNGGFEARNLVSTTVGTLHGVTHPADVARFLPQAEFLWPGITPKYTGKSIVSNWIDDPFAEGAFTSPTLGTMTSWWGAQRITEGNIYFAGEAYDEEFWSYMEGAVRSAERVAKEIHQNY